VSSTSPPATNHPYPSRVSRPLSESQVEALADDLRAMLAKVDSGDLDASAAMRYRIEGAIAALDVVQGRSRGLAAQLSEG